MSFSEDSTSGSRVSEVVFSLWDNTRPLTILAHGCSFPLFSPSPGSNGDTSQNVKLFFRVKRNREKGKYIVQSGFGTSNHRHLLRQVRKIVRWNAQNRASTVQRTSETWFFRPGCGFSPCCTGHDRLRASVPNFVRTTCFIGFRLHIMGVKKPDEDEMRHVSISRILRYRRWFLLEFGSRWRIQLSFARKGEQKETGFSAKVERSRKGLSYSLGS